VFRKDVYHKRVFGSVEDLKTSPSASSQGLWCADARSGPDLPSAVEANAANSRETAAAAATPAPSAGEGEVQPRSKALKSRTFRIESCER